MTLIILGSYLVLVLAVGFFGLLRVRWIQEHILIPFTGFQEFLAPEHKGYIITSYCFPQDPNFNFNDFYMKLNERGMGRCL